MIRSFTHSLGPDADLVVDQYDVDGAIARALVLPGFGRTADEYFHLSALLLRNRVSVLVPDFRQHPGRSAGTIMDFTLAGQAQDVATILDEFEVDAVLATSLSFPPTLRLLTERDWRGRLVGIVPVVCCADTLQVVTNVDYRDPAEDHSPDRILNIDGFDVRFELALDADRNGLMFLNDTVGNTERFGGALTMIAGARDTWVDADQVRLVAQTAKSCDLVILDEIGHDFGRSVRRARLMFQSAAENFLRSYGIEAATDAPIDVVIRSRQELRETGTTAVLGALA
ncbi:alpha/beta fold hydrolase [Dactylosporangium sp. NPDC051541]|uniref:alpha/beta fold hydrolase n=1 Tax=Dactylosporangium sp. NPDC051541 TaxID=3363977 RepID=UPI0037B37CB7